jgi:hypothetical protein
VIAIAAIQSVPIMITTTITSTTIMRNSEYMTYRGLRQTSLLHLLVRDDFSAVFSDKLAGLQVPCRESPETEITITFSHDNSYTKEGAAMNCLYSSATR